MQSKREKSEAVLKRNQEIELNTRKQKIFSLIKNQILKEYKQNLLNEVIIKKRKMRMVKTFISLRIVHKVMVKIDGRIFKNKAKLKRFIDMALSAKKIFRVYQKVIKKQGLDFE